ncbi:Ribonuclease H-like superfamily [Sesbania bispinosa]|nr:Ribonuclease H-like superfamily [Sesbania bispinosa]
MLGQGNTSVWYKDWTGYDPLCESVPFINPLVPDRWIWHEARNGAYSVMARYQWLLDNKPDWRDRPFANAWVWKVYCPEKVRLFIWLILNKGIPTNEKRFSCNLSSSPSCARCSHHLENTLHCLKDCSHSLETNLRGAHETLFVAALWWLWRWRNNQCLDSNKWSIHFVLRSIDAAHYDFFRYLGPRGGLVMMLFGSLVGVPPLLAVFHGLHLAWERGFKDLIVESDSLDVIQTLQSGLLVSFDRCSEVLSRIRNLLRRDWNVLLLHITRVVNKPADWLAKYGARTVSSFSLLEDPPPEVASLLLLDELGSC